MINQSCINHACPNQSRIRESTFKQRTLAQGLEFPVVHGSPWVASAMQFDLRQNGKSTASLTDK